VKAKPSDLVDIGQLIAGMSAISLTHKNCRRVPAERLENIFVGLIITNLNSDGRVSDIEPSTDLPNPFAFIPFNIRSDFENLFTFRQFQVSALQTDFILNDLLDRGLQVRFRTPEMNASPHALIFQ
jgi:hypothetical protein